MRYEEKFASEKLAFGLRCREIRKRKKILQKDVRDRVQLRESHLSSIEHGKFNVEFETLYKLKVALRVEIAQLFFYKKEAEVALDGFVDTDLATEKLKFSNRLSGILQHLQVNQNRLSVYIGVGEGAISTYVNGMHNLELLTMVKIAIALRIEVFDLFDYEGLLPDNSLFKPVEVEP